ncbi:hypothetical protein HOY82DRAFT_535146 [Tuber indicum]|nr:hypothetical protein HOY82DRAFT_535146 [Tuber indicum]
MDLVLLLPRSASLEVAGIAEQENSKPDTTVSKASMATLSKKPIKGGGNRKKVGKKRGRKRKVVEKKESVLVTICVYETVWGEMGWDGVKTDFALLSLADPDYGSADHGETTVGGESDDSDYENIAPVAKRVSGKGISPKKPGATNTATADSRPTRKPYTRRSAAAKTPEKKGGKSTPGKKRKAISKGTSEENPTRLDDQDDGYYPDDDNENDDNYAKAPKNLRTPAKGTAKKVPGKTAQKGTGGKTPRKTSANKMIPAEGIGKPVTRSSTGRKGPMAFKGEPEQESKDVDMLEGEVIVNKERTNRVYPEPVITAGTKRPAPKTPESRSVKVARTATGKSVRAIKAGIKALGISDRQGGEAGGSGYSIEGGTSEQRAVITVAASGVHGASVVQSEPVIGRGRLSYGGKSVAGLKALWEMGPPEDDSE